MVENVIKIDLEDGRYIIVPNQWLFEKYKIITNHVKPTGITENY
jgi:hypothetical protein